MTWLIDASDDLAGVRVQLAKTPPLALLHFQEFLYHKNRDNKLLEFIPVDLSG